MRTAIVDAPIDISALIAEVAADRNGATIVFIGTVRDVNDGRAVTGMEYTAYRGMAARELETIAADAAGETPATPRVLAARAVLSG